MCYVFTPVGYMAVVSAIFARQRSVPIDLRVVKQICFAVENWYNTHTV